MKNEDTLKKMFVEMCKHTAYFNGEFICLYSDMEYDNDYSYITESSDYSLLKEKMEKMLKLINSDSSLGDKDVETELWHML
jgi:hypothetical protein